MGPHGEEGEGPLDEREWGDVGRQLDTTSYVVHLHGMRHIEAFNLAEKKANFEDMQASTYMYI